MSRTDYAVCVAAFISCVLFWILYSLGTRTILPGSLYYVVWIGGVGGFLYTHRRVLGRMFQAWNAPSWIKFALLGYGAVLLEEVLAAFTNNLTEGFSFSLYVVRVEQFWAFNVIAFTGFIIGWYLLYRAFRYSVREVIVLAGFWGIYAEHLYGAIFSNPIGFVLLFLPTILTYGVIILPAIMSQQPSARALYAPLKYILTLVVIFVCSFGPAIALLQMRAVHPTWFPPTTFIP